MSGANRFGILKSPWPYETETRCAAEPEPEPLAREQVNIFFPFEDENGERGNASSSGWF